MLGQGCHSALQVLVLRPGRDDRKAGDDRIDEGLGGGDRDFRPGLDVDGEGRGVGERRGQCVDEAHRGRAAIAGASGHGDDVGAVLQVMAENRGDDLRVALVALDEKGADRPVDQARDQRFLLGRTAFALEVAARDLAGGVGLFLVVDGQREEVLARLGLLGTDHGDQHLHATHGHDDGTGGLAGDATGLEGDALVAELELLANDIEHVLLRDAQRRLCSVFYVDCCHRKPLTVALHERHRRC